MLRYSHYCDVCDIDFNVWKEIKDAGEERPCPHCGKQARRLFGFAVAKSDSFIYTDAWVKRREKKMAQERKHSEDYH